MMLRIMFIIAVLTVALSACGGGNSTSNTSSRTARNLDDACALLVGNPRFLQAFRQSENRWRVPASVQMAIIHQESKFIATARPPKKRSFIPLFGRRLSSSYGYTQAVKGTWEDYRNATGNRRARRSNIQDSADFVGWYADRAAKRLGVRRDDAQRLYLAYHEGLEGYARGSHRSKEWLLKVARNVADRARMYRRQISRCQAIRS